jgi:hypothetical protein
LVKYVRQQLPEGYVVELRERGLHVQPGCRRYELGNPSDLSAEEVRFCVFQGE